MVEWLRIPLAVQGMWVRPLVCAPQLLSPHATTWELMHHSKGSHVTQLNISLKNKVCSSKTYTSISIYVPNPRCISYHCPHVIVGTEAEKMLIIFPRSTLSLQSWPGLSGWWTLVAMPSTTAASDGRKRKCRLAVGLESAACRWQSHRGKGNPSGQHHLCSVVRDWESLGWFIQISSHLCNPGFSEKQSQWDGKRFDVNWIVSPKIHMLKLLLLLWLYLDKGLEGGD